MNSFGYEYKSDFARRYIQTRIRTANEGELEALVERVLTVQTLEEGVGSAVLIGARSDWNGNHDTAV